MPDSPHAKPGPYVTELSTEDEARFQAWVKKNRIPFDPGAAADYDMRGFWRAQQRGDPTALRDARTQHFPDTYKTPFHETFSNESRYATPDAPHWEGDRLVPTKPKATLMPTDNTKKKQDAEMADAYAQDRTADELDEYDAAKKRLTAGPVNDADLRYVSRYEGGNAGPIHAMPKQGDGMPVNLDDEPAPAVAAAPPPAAPVTAQLPRGVAPVAKDYVAGGGAPGLFVGAVQDLRRRRGR